MKSLTGLKEFRNRAYCLLGNGKDGLFDLMDAVITTRSVPSFAELSLSPVFRRQWSSLYKVLGRSQLPAEALMKLYVEHLPQPAQNTQLVLAGDHTAWSRLWSLYLRRFCVDHWYRFIKQRLHWCLPHLDTAEQTAVWSHLMPLMTWQLWLGSLQVQDNPLPWQKPLTYQTPGRVANAFASILVNIGTPAMLPKLRGKSPGWPTGRVRTPRPRFPTVKKSYSRPRSKTRVSG